MAEEHPQYWAAARRAAALGRAADAQDLLGLHSAFARFGEPRQRALVQPLVCATPHLAAPCDPSPSCIPSSQPGRGGQVTLVAAGVN